jgi:hypothetical protein
MSRQVVRRRPRPVYPYQVYLSNTHVVEVKKGGTHIGIYLITETDRLRGVVLPLTIWWALQNSMSIINVAISCAQRAIYPQQDGENTHTMQYQQYQEGTVTKQHLNNGFGRNTNVTTNYKGVENEGQASMQLTTEDIRYTDQIYTDNTPEQLNNRGINYGETNQTYTARDYYNQPTLYTKSSYIASNNAYVENDGPTLQMETDYTPTNYPTYTDICPDQASYALPGSDYDPNAVTYTSHEKSDAFKRDVNDFFDYFANIIGDESETQHG